LHRDVQSVYGQFVTRVDNALAALRAGATASETEDQYVEFKSEDSNVKRTLELLADAVVCLANAEGGHIVVGVDDRAGGPDAFVGVSSELTADRVVRGIFDCTRPSLSVPVEELEVAGRRLIVITVPRGATLYANVRGTATRRVGAECRPFPPEEQRQALAARGMHDWSAEPSGANLDDVDPTQLARFRRLLIDVGKEDVARLDPAHMLRDLRLADAAGMLTRAALLLAGSEDALREWIPQYEYAYQYRPSSGAESTTRFRERRPILAAIDRVMDTVTARTVIHPLNVAGGVQLQLRDYPEEAVRELLVNALVHRDYEIEGAAEVDHSPERLIVNSPGGLVYGVTPENILTYPSTPRNRLLLETVAALQVAERTGQGVDRVYREMLRVGKPPPTFGDHGTLVEAQLLGGTGNDTFVRYITNELPDAMSLDLDVLLALDLLRRQRALTAEQLASRIQRSPADAQVKLETLADRGVIEPSRRTARRLFPSYALTAGSLAALGRAVAYHRPASEAVERKVIAHVQEYGFVTNQTLQRLFDIGVYPARDLLKDLQGRGVLIKIDDRMGGRGVRYGPGPAFPAIGPRGRRK